MGEIREWTVPDEFSGMRLDKALAEHFPDLSRTRIQELIDAGDVTVGDRDAEERVCNGGNSGKPAKAGTEPGTSMKLKNAAELKAGTKLKAGQKIALTLPDPKPLDVVPQEMDLHILYEDADVLIVDKPKGLTVHPAPGHEDGTLVNGILAHCGADLSGINGVLRPGIVHRIDKDTSGALIICKNDSAHRAIAEQLKEHSITRRYRGIVYGNLPDDCGTVRGNIGRNPRDRKKMAVVREGGKPAVTHYTVLERFRGYTYCEFQLETGRTHQIRVHMASIGHPLVGDAMYGPAKCPFPVEGQALHAMVIGFVHPRTGKYMEFTAPLPDYFTKLLAALPK